MQNVYKALIDEDNCIGCRKCINVCPTDAIVGAKKVLHSVIPLLCTSCEACINACPTECISLTTLGSAMDSEQEEQLIALKNRRLNRQFETSSAFDDRGGGKKDDGNQIVPSSLDTRKQSIADAIARAKAKRQLM